MLSCFCCSFLYQTRIVGWVVVEEDATLLPAVRVIVESAPGQNGVLALINVEQVENRKEREQ